VHLIDSKDLKELEYIERVVWKLVFIVFATVEAGKYITYLVRK